MVGFLSIDFGQYVFKKHLFPNSKTLTESLQESCNHAVANRRGKNEKKVEIVLNRVESALMLTGFPNRTRTNWVEKVSDGAFLFLLDTVKSYIFTSLD